MFIRLKPGKLLVWVAVCWPAISWLTRSLYAVIELLSNGEFVFKKAEDLSPWQHWLIFLVIAPSRFVEILQIAVFLGGWNGLYLAYMRQPRAKKKPPAELSETKEGAGKKSALRRFLTAIKRKAARERAPFEPESLSISAEARQDPHSIDIIFDNVTTKPVAGGRVHITALDYWLRDRKQFVVYSGTEQNVFLAELHSLEPGSPVRLPVLIKNGPTVAIMTAKVKTPSLRRFGIYRMEIAVKGKTAAANKELFIGRNDQGIFLVNDPRLRE